MMQPRVLVPIVRWLSLERQARTSRLSRYWRDAVYMTQKGCRVLTLHLNATEHRWIFDARARRTMAKRLGVSLRELTLRYTEPPGAVAIEIEWFILEALYDWLPQLTHLDVRAFPPRLLACVGLYRCTSLTEVRLPVHKDPLSAETRVWMRGLAPQLVRWDGPSGSMSMTALSRLQYVRWHWLRELPPEIARADILPQLRELRLIVNDFVSAATEMKWMTMLEEAVATHPLLEEVRVDRLGVHAWRSGDHGRIRAMVNPTYMDEPWAPDLAMAVLNFRHHDVPIERVRLAGARYPDYVFFHLEQLKPNHLTVDPNTVPKAFAKRWNDFPRCLTLARLPSSLESQHGCTMQQFKAVEEVSFHLHPNVCWDWIANTLPVNVKRLSITTDPDDHVDACRHLPQWIHSKDMTVTVNGFRIPLKR
jgi:hypothetical protein